MGSTCCQDEPSSDNSARRTVSTDQSKQVCEQPLIEKCDEMKNNNQSQVEYTYDLVPKYHEMRNQMKYLYSSWQETIVDQVSKIIDNRKNDFEKFNIIDIGCGNGIYCRMIADRFKSINIDKIVGIDISPAQVKMAQSCTNRDKYPMISYIQMDAENVNLQRLKMKLNIDAVDNDNDIHHMDGFDIAISIWVFQAAKNKSQLSKFITNSYNVLSKNGVFVCGTVSNDDLAKNVKHGVYLNNPKFHVSWYPTMVDLAKTKDEQLCPSTIDNINNINESTLVCVEGKISSTMGDKDHVYQFDEFIYSNDTYLAFFKQAGFKNIHLLQSHEYQYGKNLNQYERELFQTFNQSKSNVAQIFICEK